MIELVESVVKDKDNAETIIRIGEPTNNSDEFIGCHEPEDLKTPLCQ